ncbi:MAG: hypothetical protein GTO51_08675 [Candidatus Latescibacteria bacterium]|nr:hypothetical protein [Candidatus Latescibacterota bacterium]NIM22026.1 hypothetical protein [Candidatus Latescibacterota bacterium]NIM66044.1 hypothetical protein [Candidatus Latescibacterota bacterium]NIO02452.1 hypothetical protein [Candidatus Latescibacterota bacterium]NIO29363.1 hypothetical protein [Candidatus Latescibacterota bacterium]
MRVAYTSDIHIDVSPQNLHAAKQIAALMADAGPDAVVLAGDLGNTLKELATVLEFFKYIDAPKLFVPGNHDLWVERDAGFGEGSDSGEKYASLIPALCDRMGFVDLGHGPFYIGDAAFVGSIGWYDYSLADPRLGLSEGDYKKGRYGDSKWLDSEMVSWRRYPRAAGEEGLSDKEICTGMVRKLESHIIEAEKRVDRIVAVIHTCPFPEALPRSEEPDYLDAFYGCEQIGQVLLAHKKIEACITGHKHVNGDWEIGGIRVHRRILGGVGPDDSIGERVQEAVGFLEL